MSPKRLLQILEDNRRLTLRTIEAFPEEALFHHAVPGMRPFADMVKEILDIEAGYMKGIATGSWDYEGGFPEVATKAALLAACRAVREETRAWWPRLTAEHLLQADDDPWTGYRATHLERLLYALENEIHHRGQAYVYLRQLGIEPPVFYRRS
ncbi:MAG: DinB family protein [Clostridia bacterium]|nr:DinB family protein [Clostridia bacterium]